MNEPGFLFEYKSTFPGALVKNKSKVVITGRTRLTGKILMRNWETSAQTSSQAYKNKLDVYECQFPS